MTAVDPNLHDTRLTVHCGGPDCDCLGTERCRALEPASAYVDGKPARVLPYDDDLGRVVEPTEIVFTCDPLLGGQGAAALRRPKPQGFLALLSAEERAEALAYRGPDGHGSADGPRAGVWSEADVDRAANACRHACTTTPSRDFPRSLAHAALSTVERRVADLIRAYKRLGGLLAEADIALTATETERATAHANLEALLTLYADACTTIWLQAVEIERQAAIITGKLAETRLIQAGPSAGGFRFDLQGGPIQYIAEYLVQMLGHRDPEPTANYCEFEVHHHEVGAMTLTLQRRSGLTPHQKAAAAEAKLSADISDEDVEVAAEAGWEELRSLMKADPAYAFEIGPWTAAAPDHAAKARAEVRAALAAFLAKRRG